MRPLWPRSLRGRLLAVALGALIAAQAVTLGALFDERGKAVAYAAAEEAAGRALALAATLDAAPPRDRSALLRRAQSRRLRFAVADAPSSAPGEWGALNRLALRISRAEARRDLRLALAEGRDDAERGGPSRRRILVSLRLADGRWLNGRATLRPPPPILAQATLASAALTAALLSAGIWLAVGRVARPIRRLAEAADRLGRGEKPAALPLDGPEELRRLAGAFNDMADRLTRLLDERARTLAAIGHDLRSPITALRLRLEMVEDDETRERMGRCVEEIQTLVEAALALARGGGAEEPVAETDIAALLRELVEELAEDGLSVEADPAPALILPARRGALKRALRNIAENAVRYGDRARLSLAREGSGARIVIEDDGPGVPTAERERVFEPFARLEASRSRDTGGAGLGLAIARAALEGQGGAVRIEDAPGGGARVVVTLRG